MLTESKVIVSWKANTPDEDTTLNKFLDCFHNYLKGGKVDKPALLSYNISTNSFKYITPQKFEAIPSVAKVLNVKIEGLDTPKRIASTSKILVKTGKIPTTMSVESLLIIRSQVEIAVVNNRVIEFKKLLKIEDAPKIVEPVVPVVPVKRGRGRPKKNIVAPVAQPVVVEPEGTIKLANKPVDITNSNVELQSSNYRLESSDGSYFVVDGLIMK